MNATNTALGAGTAVLGVDAIAGALSYWMAYEGLPAPTDIQLTGMAVIIMVVFGTVLGAVWYFITAIVRAWMRRHQIEEPVQTMINP